MTHDPAAVAATPLPRPPAPTSVSAEAQEFLAVASTFDSSGAAYPDLEDTDGWLALVEQMDGLTRGFYQRALPSEEALERELIDVAGVPTYALRPTGVERGAEGPIFVDLHGGALCFGGGELAWMAAAASAVARPGVTWSPDYRMPPLHPFPAALDDSLAVYREAVRAVGPERVVVSGTSAGGNLAAAVLLRAREEGIAMPAGLVLLSPEVDLTESGDTFRANFGIDFLRPVMEINKLYAAGQDLAHPHLSPLFGDHRGFPRTFLQSGTRDIFLSNTVRMHRSLHQAGVEAELHVFEAMPHGSFSGVTPEDDEVRALARAFERECLGLG